MCLYTTQKRAGYTDKPIVCYKVVCKYTSISVFISMYRGFEYELGKLRKEKSFKCMPRESGAVYYGFHSYRTIKEASSWASSMDVILKCEIPAGSRFYKSVTNTEYCSNRIKVLAWRRMKETKWHFK